jgi:hypothetical protein
MYVGGYFTRIGGQTRNAIAALSMSTGQATSWNPGANYDVGPILVSGGTVYVGGAFTYIGGQPRQGIAALSASTGQATSWNPDAHEGANTGYVNSLALSGSALYVGGSFTQIGGQSREKIAALDVASGVATAWNPQSDGNVYALAVAGSTVFAGGTFGSMGAVGRNRLAAFDVASGEATPWNPNAGTSGSINAMMLRDGVVYVGGSFTSLGGQSRSRLAAIDAVTGLATSWNPNPNGTIDALASGSSTIYVSGGFTSVGGQARSMLAAIRTADGQVEDWNPSPNSNVSTLVADGDVVYAGGYFTNIGGQPRSYIAALDATTGAATEWNPNANNVVRSLAVSADRIYAGGRFTSIGGQSRSYLAELSASSAQASTWNPGVSAGPTVLAIAGSAVCAGGGFVTTDIPTRNNLAAWDVATGQSLPWAPVVDSSVEALAVGEKTVYLGGNFDTVGGTPHRKLAAIGADFATSGWPLAAGAPCLRFRLEESVPGTVHAVRLSGALPKSAKTETPVPIVDGFAVFDRNAVDSAVNFQSAIDSIELLNGANPPNVIGHIGFRYTDSDFDSGRNVDAYLFVHNDDSTWAMNSTNDGWLNHQNGWGYYNDNEYPVSMLVPPHAAIDQVQGGTARPVVFVHGIAGYYPYFGTVPDELATGAYEGWQFSYPYDQSIFLSSRLLGRAIQKLISEDLFGCTSYDANRVDIVAHSMGGLVARQYIQGPEFANDINKLLMLGTPNHGSYLSYRMYYDDFAPGETWGEAFKTHDPEAPAHEQMAPGSQFLFDLDSAPPRGLGSGEVAKDYLVIAGISNGTVVDRVHQEIWHQDDDVVALSSASLLDRGDTSCDCARQARGLAERKRVGVECGGIPVQYVQPG